MRLPLLASLALLALTASPVSSAGAQIADAVEGDAILKNFAFHTGEKFSELKMHYTTLGTPQRDAKGDITNAVMILHGTGGTGK